MDLEGVECRVYNVACSVGCICYFMGNNISCPEYNLKTGKFGLIVTSSLHLPFLFLSLQRLSAVLFLLAISIFGKSME